MRLLNSLVFHGGHIVVVADMLTWRMLRNIVVTLDFHHDQVAFADVAKEVIQKHATKSREQWREEILGAGE